MKKQIILFAVMITFASNVLWGQDSEQRYEKFEFFVQRMELIADCLLLVGLIISFYYGYQYQNRFAKLGIFLAIFLFGGFLCLVGTMEDQPLGPVLVGLVVYPNLCLVFFKIGKRIKNSRDNHRIKKVH